MGFGEPAKQQSFIEDNFSNEMLKLQKSYETSLEHPETADAFHKQFTETFQKIADAANKAGIREIGLALEVPGGGTDGGPAISTPGASKVEGAIVDVTGIAAMVRAGTVATVSSQGMEKRADSTSDVDRSADAGIVRSTPDQSNDKGIAVRSNAGGPRPM